MTAVDQIIIPTRERLRAANDNFVVDPATRAYHFTDTPVDRLQAAGKLTNVQAEAAQRFYADFYAAGLSPLGAIDYSKDHVDGTPPTWQSDYRMSASDRYRSACGSMTAQTRKFVDRVVLREMSVEAAGRDVTGRANAREARAVAMDRLSEGLNDLAVFYKLITRTALDGYNSLDARVG